VTLLTWKSLPISVCLAPIIAVVAVAAVAAQPRIGDFSVRLGDHDLTVDAVVFEAIPLSFGEGMKSGLPAHLRLRVELWQHNRMWPDRLLETRSIDRQIVYNVVTQEFQVASLAGETRDTYTSRRLVDAQRVLSELRGVKLLPASPLDPAELFYVRIRAEVALGGASSLLTRLSGDAEETGWVRSSLLTVSPRRRGQ
jgi:hypothetical protein